MMDQSYTDLQAARPARGADRLDEVAVAGVCFRANEVAPRLADAMPGCAKNPWTPAVVARTRITNNGNVAIELQSFMAYRDEREKLAGQIESESQRQSAGIPASLVNQRRLTWQTPSAEPVGFQKIIFAHDTGGTQAEGRAMGLRERFLTAGVAVPLSLWTIFYDARLCLSLVLVLQAICVQELHELLRRTRSGCAAFLQSPGFDVPDACAQHTPAFAVAVPTCCFDCRASFMQRPGCLNQLVSTPRLIFINHLPFTEFRFYRGSRSVQQQQ